MTRPLRLAPFLLLAACAGGAPPGEPAPGGAPALAYRMPSAEPLTYQQVDSGGFTMQIPGAGDVNVDIVARITANLDFEQAADDRMRVVVRLTDVGGRFANSMGPTVTVDNQHRPGPATLTVDAAGDVDVVEQPPLPEALAQVITPQGLYRNLFVPLPGGAAARGATWTDTVRIADSLQGMSVTTTSVVRSTWARDTVLDGRTLAVIESDSDDTITASGMSQGVEVRQNLAGTSRAVTLWDVRASTLVAREQTGEATGTTDLPGMGITGIPVTARSLTTLRLRR